LRECEITHVDDEIKRQVTYHCETHDMQVDPFKTDEPCPLGKLEAHFEKRLEETKEAIMRDLKGAVVWR
jgi:hypothetical protein